MEVAYFKILDPIDRKKSLKLVSDFMKFFGGLRGWEKVVTSEADEKTSRIFVFDKISKIDKAKEFLLSEGCLLEFELKTKDYLIMKNVDESFFNDEINFKILENFLKKNFAHYKIAHFQRCLDIYLQCLQLDQLLQAQLLNKNFLLLVQPYN